jgi:hypothetical protein
LNDGLRAIVSPVRLSRFHCGAKLFFLKLKQGTSVGCRVKKRCGAVIVATTSLRVGFDYKKIEKEGQKGGKEGEVKEGKERRTSINAQGKMPD